MIKSNPFRKDTTSGFLRHVKIRRQVFQRLPGIVKGLDLCLLYVSLGIQPTNCIPANDLPTAIGFMIIVRSFLARGLFSALFTYLLYTGRVRHLDSIAGLLDPAWTYRWRHGRQTKTTDYNGFVQRQAYLASAKNLTNDIIMARSIALVLVIIWIIADRIRRRPPHSN